MAKRHRKLTFVPSEQILETQTKVVSELRDGVEYQKVKYETVDVTDPSYTEDLPRREEYTLSNLLAAGVPLEQLNTSDLLGKNLDTKLAEVDVALGKMDELNNEEK